ncbi:MAG TPA: NADPH:quinone oxidoreductase family protein [Polyangiaceae bacterium LLY-WYZ-15_(1-7)]|nr:NADPH:quinone oxidoreductase family protein [Polyangiaceae bacterium LLY-WYZ-15_(1-7)]HJL04647.1 NADPH:quinone oxidoreductase family protein [Polyangiaceae bacterium LLY-WYZ-15_(1-7)]HJL07429.1 NADPH:quinone oxidoreductase family protein [Polyangiaceae bacterium LLY-WYZ-15_(1-7)]HJL22195.1 NADPH:quinone oxidoreductase family protein [Polyangiaceae bacterium LLY-WYZ-15_(1-7)]HJL28673.1 NADPH:quinone oxidoreductase family protein [Polyangiaceae bacterium LLY-WYZ-15_(1-7)]
MGELESGRRVVVRELGESPMEALEAHVALETQPPPDPAALAEDDVIVAVKASGVNWVDLIMTSGQYQHVPEPPYTPGLEYAGEVAWVGPAVSGLAIGDRVMADGLLTGPRSLGAHRRWGGWASWAVAPAKALLPLPEALSFDQGATVLGAYETAYHALVFRGRLQAGESVLIVGASGTTGLAAVHVAKALDATVIATGRRAEKLEVVKAEGADHVIATADGEGGVRRFRDEVKELTGGRGVDVVHDGVGGKLTYESLRSARFGARYLIVGWAATPFVAKGKGGRGAPNANVIPTNLIMMKGLDVLGCPAAITAHKDPSIRAERLAAIRRWLEEGAVRPLVSASWPLEEVHEAMRAKWKSAYPGAITVRP